VGGADQQNAAPEHKCGHPRLANRTQLRNTNVAILVSPSTDVPPLHLHRLPRPVPALGPGSSAGFVALDDHAGHLGAEGYHRLQALCARSLLLPQHS